MRTKTAIKADYGLRVAAPLDKLKLTFCDKPSYYNVVATRKISPRQRNIIYYVLKAWKGIGFYNTTLELVKSFPTFFHFPVFSNSYKNTWKKKEPIIAWQTNIQTYKHKYLLNKWFNVLFLNKEDKRWPNLPIIEFFHKWTLMFSMLSLNLEKI